MVFFLIVQSSLAADCVHWGCYISAIFQTSNPSSFKGQERDSLNEWSIYSFRVLLSNDVKRETKFSNADYNYDHSLKYTVCTHDVHRTRVSKA